MKKKNDEKKNDFKKTLHILQKENREKKIFLVTNP